MEMEMEMTPLFLLIFALAMYHIVCSYCSYVAAELASHRNRAVLAWAIMGLCCGLFGVVLIYCLPKAFSIEDD